MSDVPRMFGAPSDESNDHHAGFDPPYTHRYPLNTSGRFPRYAMAIVGMCARCGRNAELTESGGICVQCSVTEIETRLIEGDPDAPEPRGFLRGDYNDA